LFYQQCRACTLVFRPIRRMLSMKTRLLAHGGLARSRGYPSCHLLAAFGTGRETFKVSCSWQCFCRRCPCLFDSYYCNRAAAIGRPRMAHTDRVAGWTTFCLAPGPLSSCLPQSITTCPSRLSKLLKRMDVTMLFCRCEQSLFFFCFFLPIRIYSLSI
jgi:hypothetical protein